MTKPRKERFSFQSSKDLKRDVENEEVAALQAILTTFGYLRGTYEPGRFCRFTERAVRRYQRFYGLKSDGIVGPITKQNLERPRCGVPDIFVNARGAGVSAPYVLRGCEYNRQLLTYAFLNGTDDLTGERERQIVRQAFDAWANIADLRFTEVQPVESPDFRIAWRLGDHGDGESFDGPGNTLAHAFFPPPCGGPNAGDLHFDEGEVWIEDPGDNGIVLQHVAIHEIGHLLGLSHSQDETAIMYAYYSPERGQLAQDDIDGIRALYGERTERREVLLAAEASGTLARAADAKIFEVEIPRMLSVSIDGPADADFDLYVRKSTPPTVDQWDYRAYTVSSDERIVFPAEAGVKYHIMVRSYDGSGDFTLKVEPSVA